MKPYIPFEFDPDSSNYEDILSFGGSEEMQVVAWDLAGISIRVPEHRYWPDLDQAVKANGGLVAVHGLSGFSVGSYHEFFVSELPIRMGFRMGKVEVSFGQASPLIAFLFEGNRSKWHGTWDTISTARITAADAEEAEIAFLNASIRYSERLGHVPTIWNMYEFSDEEDEEDRPILIEKGPAIREIDPVRFFYHGISQSDSTAACIYFYRVLEYYSFLFNRKQMQKLRNDTALSEDEFAKQILLLATRDEKGPILQVVKTLADDGLLKLAIAAQLIKDKESSLLGEAIYAFRNSIVHGKVSYGYALQSTSVFVEGDRSRNALHMEDWDADTVASG